MNETLLSYIQAPRLISRNSVLDNKSHINQISQNERVSKEYRQKKNSIREQTDIVSISHKQSKKDSHQKNQTEKEPLFEFKSFEEELKSPSINHKHIDIKV